MPITRPTKDAIAQPDGEPEAGIGAGIFGDRDAVVDELEEDALEPVPPHLFTPGHGLADEHPREETP